jgi:hypothetical protein
MRRFNMSLQAVHCLAFIGLALTVRAYAAPISLPNKMDSLMPETHTSRSYAPIDSLEMVGVGVSVETWRNHPDYPKFNLWQAIEASNGSYIISQDTKQYPKNLDEYQMAGSKRLGDAVDVALRDFMDRYPLPIAVVGPAWHGPDDEKARTNQRTVNAKNFITTMWDAPYTARGEFGGLLTQSGQVMNSYLNDEPDLLWQTIFATFEQHGDIPALAVASKDGTVHGAVAHYKSNRPLFDKLMAEQAYRPKQPRTVSDSVTFITLVRRGRIDWLRPYAPLVEDNMEVKDFGGRDGFARNSSEFAGWKKSPPQPFVPTPFVAVPWTPFQIAQYDHLEHLGTLYRPQVVSYLDQHGKPVKSAERALRMTAALRAALAPLNGKLPTRIIYDYGSVWNDSRSAARFLPLAQGVHAIDDEFDLLNPKRGYDLARILGDTGAGSPFVGVALASMAGRQSGGATLVANLRRNDGATLLLVTPPSAEQIKKDAAIKRPFFPDKANAKKMY